MFKLLQGGTVLIHGEGDRITPTVTDILLQDDRIALIEKEIAPPANADIVDCTGKIISPGFVDSHRHLWQTMLKGLFGNAQFMPYLSISKGSTLKKAFLNMVLKLIVSHCSQLAYHTR